MKLWISNGRLGDRIFLLGMALIALCIGVGNAGGATYDLIISGSGGEELYSERFGDWSQRLRTVLIEQCGHRSENVRLLDERGEISDGISSMDGIRKVFGEFSRQVTARDDVFVFLMGHGSYRRQVAKLNIPGPDLTAKDLDVLLDMLPARRVVVVNGASMSAPFVNVLSDKGRIVCASTRSIDQRNATRFMGFFVQALEDGSADQDRDERISVLEICKQASSLTDAWFLGEGMIVTENAILDDDGDGRGTRLSNIDAGDGDVAERCFLLDFKVPQGTAPELVEAYGQAIDDVQNLKKKKASLSETAYYQALEEKLLKAARLNRKIRDKK